MDPGLAAAISAVAVLLGVVIGRLLEGRSERRRWWRDKRRDAYSQLLSCQQEFLHVTTIAEGVESPETRTAWLTVQQATSAVELAAPDDVAMAAKELAIAVRRNSEVLSELRASGYVPGAERYVERAQKASDNVIVARAKFVKAARRDLLRG